MEVVVWKEIVRRCWTEHQFFPGCSTQQIEEAGDRLSIQLPPELRELLCESNGVHGPFGLGLVWPLERIVEVNASFRANADFRELYMPFDSLLFFADAGNGDQFAFALNNGRVRRPDIYAWNHEDDSRIWVAPSLQQYIDWSACGKIKL